MKHDVDEPL